MEITDNRGNILTVDELAIPNGYINVKHYGVRGDGVTYDTGAIQALLGVDENGRPEHPRLYFPYGSYLIDELIFDGMGWHIIGDGGINPSFYMEQDPKFGDYYKATVFKSVAQEVDTNKALFNIGGEHYHTVNSHTHTIPAHTHTVSAHTHTTPNHSHTVTEDNVGSAAPISNMPPYLVVYIWERTA